MASEDEKIKEVRGLSRRSFLKSSALGVAGIAATAALAGCSPDSTASMETPAAETEPEAARDIPPVDPPDKWDYEADLAIIGGGGSGLAAAAKALDNGKTVVIMEQLAFTGGICQHASLPAAYNTQVGARNGVPWDDTVRSQVLQHCFDKSGYTIDMRELATLVDRSHELYDWAETKGWDHWDILKMEDAFDLPHSTRIMINGFGQFDGKSIFSPGGSYLATQMPFTDWLAKFVKDNGGEILLSTKAQALVKDGDKIVGVKAKDINDKDVYVKGTMAVILAGSGFTNNRDMLKKYIPRAYETVLGSMIPPYDTGEAIRMAFGAGADLAGEGTYMTHRGAIDFLNTEYTGKDEPGPWSQYLRQGWVSLAYNPWLTLNESCEKFLRFADGMDYTKGGVALVSTPGRASYRIFDADFETTIWKFDPIMDSKPILPTDPNPTNLDGKSVYDALPGLELLAPKNWMDSVNKAIELGGIKKADTIEELAKELRLDPSKLKAAVDAWNAQCASGTVDEFGQPPQYQIPILKAPFYGLKTGGMMAGTLCGARVNANFQVLDKKQNVIPGLYAAGLCIGGGGGEFRLETTALSFLGFGLATGFIAGDNASAERSLYTPDTFV